MPGRHRRRSSYAGKRLAAAATAVVVVATGSWLAYRQIGAGGCDEQVRLTLTAAEEIAPAVASAAAAWAGGETTGCVVVDVSTADSAEVVAAVANRYGGALAGVGNAAATIGVPDVWVPDSSTWLLRLRSEVPGFAVKPGSSIAQSPVVMAMPEPAAETLGWPDKELVWKDVLNQITRGGDLRSGIVDPTRDAAGLSALLAMAQAADALDAAETTAGVLRTLAVGESALRKDLLEKFPQARDAASIATALSAAPLSERDVITYNAAGPPVPLAALYLDNPTATPLDYPYTPMPDLDATRAAAAQRLRTALQGASFADALARQGLRNPDGTVGGAFPRPTGAPGARAATAPGGGSPGEAAGGLDTAAVDRALGTWAAVTLPGRLLGVFDVSGSMRQKVLTARGATRAEVMRAAAAKGLGLFDDQWSVGIWIFSDQLQGTRDWRELVPITPLTTGRQAVLNSLDELVPAVQKAKSGDDGGTGLYDTVLSAYTTVQRDWAPDRVNSVVVFTDGKNEDDGLTRAALVAQLRKLNDPVRPVRLVVIGIGDGVDPAELRAITAPVGGLAFVQEDPAKIGEIFLKAIASRGSASR